MQTDSKGEEASASSGLHSRRKPRRKFTPEQRLAMVREREAPDVWVAEIALRNRINTNLLYERKRLHERGELAFRANCASLVFR